ncbi:MAG: hypothetical protein QOF79_1006 [Actinomycetota bacterium]|nr:hypothetical protein [Actinomycetota bacterium]
MENQPVVDAGVVDWPLAEWLDLREEIVPLIGERAFSLFAFAVCDVSSSAAASEYFRKSLLDSGTDPVRPQVTETEQLLIDWGRSATRGDVEGVLATRFDRVLSPQLGALLRRGVGLMRPETTR